MAIAEVTGLKQIHGEVWYIRAGMNEYLFVGSKHELEAALSRVRRESMNKGNQVHYKKVVR